MRIEVPAPGCPEVFKTATPAALPWIPWSKEVIEVEDNCSDLIVEIDEVRSLFFCTPYPTTTTSANTCVSSSSTMLNSLFCAVTLTIFVWYPMKEISSIDLSGTDNENSPSLLEMVPCVEPCCKIVAPTMGSPIASRTIPLMFKLVFCALTLPRININNNKVMLLNKLFMCSYD